MSRHQRFQKEAPSLFKFSQLLCDSVMTLAEIFFQTWDRKSQRRGEGIVSENVPRMSEDLDWQSTQEASRLSCISISVLLSFSFSLTLGALLSAIQIPCVQKSPCNMIGDAHMFVELT